METSTKDLKRVLGLKELIGVAVGQIIGAGIMSLMGVAIGLTGRSVPISFLLSALVVLVSSIPIILVCGTVRLRGGNYTMTALLSGQKMAGFLMFVTIIANISLLIYAMTANTFDEDVRQVIDAGMNGHVGKPYNPQKLYQVLSHALGA